MKKEILTALCCLSLSFTYAQDVPAGMDVVRKYMDGDTEVVVVRKKKAEIMQFATEIINAEKAKADSMFMRNPLRVTLGIGGTYAGGEESHTGSFAEDRFYERVSYAPSVELEVNRFSSPRSGIVLNAHWNMHSGTSRKLGIGLRQDRIFLGLGYTQRYLSNNQQYIWNWTASLGPTFIFDKRYELNPNTDDFVKVGEGDLILLGVNLSIGAERKRFGYKFSIRSSNQYRENAKIINFSNMMLTLTYNLIAPR